MTPPVLAPLTRGLRRAQIRATAFLQDRFHFPLGERLIIRAALVWLLWGAILPGPLPFHSQPHPVGLAQFFDLTFMSDAATFGTLRLLAQSGLILYLLGLLQPLGLLLFLVPDVCLHTLATSQGAHGHGAQLNALLALGMIVAALAHAVRHRQWRPLLLTSAASEQSTLAGARLMLASAYIVAGLSKVTAGGWDWWLRGDCFIIQIKKAQDEQVFTFATPDLHETALAFGNFLEAHPSLAIPMLAAALFAELFAFVALTTRLRALTFGLLLIGFHKANGWLMGLPFSGNVWALTALFACPAFWLFHRLPSLRNPPPAAPQPIQPLWRTPALMSIAVALFMLLRGEWYPFTPFPMYASLPDHTHIVYATDLDGTLIPWEQFNTVGPVVKKTLTTELKKIRDEQDIDRPSLMTDEHWQQGADRVMALMLAIDTPRRHQGPFHLMKKNYETADGNITVTESLLGTYTVTPP